MTLAGLNTVNLSTLNTFQQFLLFILTILGSAILVSILVVHIRKKAFERRFKSVVETDRQRRRDRSSSSRRPSFSRSLSRNKPEVDGVVVRGRAIISEKHSKESLSRAAVDGARDTLSSDSDRGRALVSERHSRESLEGGPIDEDRDALSALPENSSIQNPHPSAGKRNQEDSSGESAMTIDTGLTRRIAFAPSTSPRRAREHGQILSMQGVGARQSLHNHPMRSPVSIYASESQKPGETMSADLSHPSSVQYGTEGVIGRNSQFSSLSLAERERIGGVEYQALTLLSVIVPLYFILWQLLGCLGVGAYVASKRAAAALANSENPWWVGSFNAVSAFNNSGMSLLDANMTAFQTADYMLITMGLLILAGNTCYPVFLRLIIWTTWKILPETGRCLEHKSTLRFLLDHPRRCYTNLFPSRHTWWLLGTLVCLNGTDWVAFEVLNIGNSAVESLPRSARALDGLFQALAVRSGGFYVVTIPNLRIGLLILYVLMMYISVYPVVITMRNSNVYEERSLGIYADDAELEKRGHEELNEKQSLAGKLKRRLTNQSKPVESRGYFVRQQLRGQLAHDLWWIVLAVLFIMITESGSFEHDPVTYSVFNVIFEVVSAYGCVGISVGLPNQAYSFCGGWHVLSKLILCAVMIRGRHRGLPVAIDRAVLLPGDHLAAAEEEDAQIRLERTMTKNRGAV